MASAHECYLEFPDHGGSSSIRRFATRSPEWWQPRSHRPAARGGCRSSPEAFQFRLGFWGPPRLLACARGAPEDRLPFQPLRVLVETAPPEPEWSSRGYLALSTLVLLAGRPKVGKSTLVFALIASAIRGDAFLGLAAKARGVLLLTEERRDTLAEKARVLGLMDADVPVYALSRHEAQATTWPEVVRDAMSFCREHELDVLIVDTLDRGQTCFRFTRSSG